MVESASHEVRGPDRVNSPLLSIDFQNCHFQQILESYLNLKYITRKAHI